jgi:hypothetical protein
MLLLNKLLTAITHFSSRIGLLEFFQSEAKKVVMSIKSNDFNKKWVIANGVDEYN